MPITAAAIAAGAGAVYKIGEGISENVKAKRLSKTPRPTYAPPTAAEDALNLAKIRAARTTLPGQAMMENKIGATAANTIGALKEVSPTNASLLAGVSAAGANQGEQVTNLSIEAARQKAINEATLVSQLGTFAGYQDKAFEINKYQPYINAMNKAAQLQAAGKEKIYGGIKDVSGIASVLFGKPTDTNNKTGANMGLGVNTTQASNASGLSETLGDVNYLKDNYGLNAGATFRANPAQYQIMEFERKELEGTLSPSETIQLKQLRGY